MGPKDADGLANRVDQDQTAPLIWSTLFAQAYLSENLRSLRFHNTKKLFLTEFSIRTSASIKDP